MSLHVHALTRARIRRLFSTGLEPGAYRHLLRELPGCPSCAALYARLDALESALCAPGSDAPTPFALERVQAAVLQQLAAPRPSARARWRWALAPAAVLAIALAFVVLRPPGDSERLAARGVGPSRGADVGIRLLRATPSAIEETTTVSLDDLVTFTYTSADPSRTWLALFGVQEDGQVRWYYPGAEGSASIRVPGGRVDEALGDGIRLSVNHRPGWLRVTAVFSAQPIATRRIEEAVRALASTPPRLHDLAPLSLGDGALEHSLLVNVVQP